MPLQNAGVIFSLSRCTNSEQQQPNVAAATHWCAQLTLQKAYCKNATSVKVLAATHHHCAVSAKGIVRMCRYHGCRCKVTAINCSVLLLLFYSLYWFFPTFTHGMYDTHSCLPLIHLSFCDCGCKNRWCAAKCWLRALLKSHCAVHYPWNVLYKFLHTVKVSCIVLKKSYLCAANVSCPLLLINRLQRGH